MPPDSTKCCSWREPSVLAKYRWLAPGVDSGLDPHHPGRRAGRGQRARHDLLADGGGHGEGVDAGLRLIAAGLWRPLREGDPLRRPGRGGRGVAHRQPGGQRGVAGLAQRHRGEPPHAVDQHPDAQAEAALDPLVGSPAGDRVQPQLLGLRQPHVGVLRPGRRGLADRGVQQRAGRRQAAGQVPPLVGGREAAVCSSVVASRVRHHRPRRTPPTGARGPTARRR